MENNYKAIIIRNGYEFRCTCFACPEQYDVFRDSKYVAYIRKRWGRLAVNPVKNGEVMWNEVIYCEVDDDPYAGTIENLDATIDKIVEAIEGHGIDGSKKVWIRAK